MSAVRGPLTFRLGSDGVETHQSVQQTEDNLDVVSVLDSKAPGLAVLQVGPKPPNDLVFPHLGAARINLDAAACRHLAMLLELKAAELDATGLNPSSAEDRA